ncbi:response regulator transcription factor [Fodinibacter luteus]|uniref:Response regulator transcription factor n=1 Tax=Fodinibacter luteus TaxID=552064 RepID=A0ABP8KPU8_9MICO
MAHILIVEDETRISDFLDRGLRAAGHVTSVAADGHTGLHLALGGDVDLVVLDLGLPDRDGLDVLRELRGSGSEVPVIVLTARGGVRDTVAGLTTGATDYVVKPFHFAELEARVTLRLAESRRAATTSGRPDETRLVAGDVVLDLLERRLTVGGTEHDLTEREFHLVETLLRHPGQVLSREQLLNLVWGFDFAPGSNVVDVYVAQLRSKLGRERIETVRGAGYRFRG